MDIVDLLCSGSSVRNFHQLSMKALPFLWEALCTRLGIPTVKPLISQTINRLLLNQVLYEGASAKTLLNHKHPTMCFEEENAVRYAGGYVALKVMRIFEEENTQKAAQFVNCLSQMDHCGEESSFYSYTKEWISRVNRGLFCISESTFLFFRTVELKTQLCLSSHLQRQSSTSSKDILLNQITEDDDVQFQWLLQSVDIQEESHSAELLRTVDWVKIRGFSLTSVWLEEYKRSEKKGRRVFSEKELKGNQPRLRNW